MQREQNFNKGIFKVTLWNDVINETNFLITNVPERDIVRTFPTEHYLIPFYFHLNLLRNLYIFSIIPILSIYLMFRMDGIKRYMEHHEIPGQLQDRVKRWLQYSWLRWVFSDWNAFELGLFCARDYSICNHMIASAIKNLHYEWYLKIVPKLRIFAKFIPLSLSN